MSKIELGKARSEFDNEVFLQKKLILTRLEEVEAKKRIEQIDKKVIHTNEVIIDGLETAKVLNFNESNLDLSHIVLMDHDIGRFPQMTLTGNYKDVDLDNKYGIKDHGILGKKVLDGLLVHQLPGNESIYNIVKTVVENHVSKKCDAKSFKLLNSGLFVNYSIDEIISMCNEEQLNDVVNCLTQLVQDVDRLDIYHQILSGRWTPIKREDLDIDPKVFEMFYNGEYLNMAKLREAGLWNANVGELVRLSFIDQIKLLSVAKIIKAENLIMKMKALRNNPKAGDAFDFANEKLDKMIANSEDGVLVGKVR